MGTWNGQWPLFIFLVVQKPDFEKPSQNFQATSPTQGNPDSLSWAFVPSTSLFQTFVLIGSSVKYFVYIMSRYIHSAPVKGLIWLNSYQYCEYSCSWNETKYSTIVAYQKFEQSPSCFLRPILVDGLCVNTSSGFWSVTIRFSLQALANYPLIIIWKKQPVENPYVSELFARLDQCLLTALVDIQSINERAMLWNDYRTAIAYYQSWYFQVLIFPPSCWKCVE